MQALVDEETLVKMINFSYDFRDDFRDPKMEAEFLHSQVYVMQARHCVCVCVCACVVCVRVCVCV